MFQQTILMWMALVLHIPCLLYTFLQELKAEFDRVIPGVYATPETDKRTITIVQKADGQLFLDIR